MSPGRRRAAGPGEGRGWGGRLPRAQAGRTRRLRPRGEGAGRPTWARSGAAGPGLARPRRRGSALPAAAASAEAAAAARPPSCSALPGALRCQGARSRAPARRAEARSRREREERGGTGSGWRGTAGRPAGAVSPLHGRALWFGGPPSSSLNRGAVGPRKVHGNGAGPNAVLFDRV